MIRNLYDTEGNYWVSRDINLNGHDYVDLALPSRTLWAWKNVGAASPDESGLYFQWGDTKGYTKDQIGTGDGKKAFKWDDCKWNASQGFTKYNTVGEALELEDDAANANMGGTWHMPTPEQIQELINETTSTWTQQNNVYGRLFTSKKNGKSIFIPAAGYASGGSVYNSGSFGLVWSSMLDTIYVNYGQYLNFDSSYINLYDSNRYCGYSVRGVIG